LTPDGCTDKQGSAWLRWILCEAAQTAKRHPDYAASYAAIARRRGKKIATTAIARKLLTRAWHLLTDAQRAAGLAAINSAPGSGHGAVTSREGSPSPG
jgi:transposase